VVFAGELQGLLDSHQQHVALMERVITAGDRLSASLSSKGREVIRQQTCDLQRDWDELFTMMTCSHRQLDMTLVEWTSHDDCVRQVEAWLVKMRSQVTDDLPLVGSLDDKKSQLHMFKVMLPVCLVM